MWYNKNKGGVDVHIVCYETESFVFRHSVSTDDYFSSHSHNQIELLLIEQGDVYHVIEDKRYPLRKNDLVVIRPAVFHYIDRVSDAPYERYDVQFPLSWVSDLDAERIFETLAVVPCAEKGILCQTVKKMEYYYRTYPEKDFLALAQMLMREIFYNLAREGVAAEQVYAVQDGLFSRALAYINAHLHTLKDVSEVSDTLHVSESYLYRLFRQNLRVTPRQYVTDKRLLEAQTALGEGEKPTRICYDVGFGEYSTFYRCYKQKFGHSPCRRENQEKP